MENIELLYLFYYQFLFIILFIITNLLDRGVSKKEKYIFKHRPVLQYNRGDGNKFIRFINRVPIYLIVFFTTFLVFCLICIFNEEYCYCLLENINDIEQIVVAFVAIAISVIIFFVTLSTKKYNFSFNAKSILKKYKIYLSYNFIIMFTLVSIVCTFLLQEYNLEMFLDAVLMVTYISSIFIVICWGTYIILVVGIIALDDNKAEKGALNKLYEDYWNNNLLEYDGDVYSDIHSCLPYLIHKFVNKKLCIDI